MPTPLTLPAMHKGRLRVRLAETGADLAAAQALRGRVFRAGADAARDADHFDADCAHLLVEDSATDRLLGCVRLLMLSSGRELRQSYSAQFYDLEALSQFEGPMLEVGRLCTEPGARDPDVLRAVLCAITRIVDGEGVEMMFGCTSFPGTDAGRYHDAFALLRSHLAPRRWLPRVKAPQIFDFARRLTGSPDRRRALTTLPPLLRSYLGLGGWVSDHAVVDEELGTLHVFTGVEVGAIPPVRKRLLRAAAGG